MHKLIPTALLGVFLAGELACGAGGGASAPQTAAAISVRLIGPAQLAVDAQGGFTVTVTGTTNTAVTWTTTGGSISADGLLTAPSTAGPVTVTATSVADPTKSASASVAVVEGVAVAVSGPSTLAPGATGTFTATVTGASNTAVTWSASAGTITPDGTFTAPNVTGPVLVAATSVADPSKTASSTVNVAVPTPSVTLATSAPRPSYATSGREYLVNASGVFGDSLIWSSTNASIVSGQGTASVSVKPEIPGRPFAVHLATTNAAGTATASWQGTAVSLPEGPLQAPRLLQPGREYRVGLPGYRPGLEVTWAGAAPSGSYANFIAPASGTVAVSATAQDEALSLYAGSGEMAVTPGIFGRLWQGYAYSTGSPVIRPMQGGQILLGPNSSTMNSGWHVYQPSSGLIDDLQGGLPGGARINVTTADALNGTVVVIGGARNATYTGQIDVVDPGSSSPFSTLPGTLTTLRASCSAVALGNGKILVAGGSVPGSPTSYIASAELIDTATGVVTPASSAPEGRLGGSLVASGGKALWIGGRIAGGLQAPNWVYDPATDTWGTFPSNLTPRTAPTIVLSDGRIVVYSGSTIAGARLTDLEIFQPGTSSWTAHTLPGGLQPLPAPATPSLRAAELPDGRVLFFGSGDTSQPVSGCAIWDTATTWEHARVPSRRGFSILVSTPTGVAGFGGANLVNWRSFTASSYNSDLDEWSNSGTESAEADALASSSDIRAVASGSSVLATGVNSFGSVVINPDTGATTAIPGYQDQSRGILISLGGGKAVMVGGGTPGGPSFASCQLFDGASWSYSGTLLQGRDGFSWLLLSDGRLLVAGGSALTGGSAGLTSTEIFDPATGTWSAGPALLAPRTGGALLERTDGKIWLIGGQDQASAVPGELLDLVAGTSAPNPSAYDLQTSHSYWTLPTLGHRAWIISGATGLLLDADTGTSIPLSDVAPLGKPAVLPDGRLLWGGRVHSLADGTATLTGSPAGTHPFAVSVPNGALVLGGGVPEIYIP